MCEVLTQIFGIGKVNKPTIEFSEDIVTVHATLKKERGDCPKCQSSHTIFRGKKNRKFHLPPIGSKRAVLLMRCQRNHCKSCKYTWWPSFSFSDGKSRMTTSFINHALDLLKMGTVKDVADHLGVSWDTIKEIHKNYLQKQYAKIDLSNIKYMSVDEFSIRKGHSYMTVFSDITTGRVVHAVEGRKKEDIAPFLQEVKKRPLSYVL